MTRSLPTKTAVFRLSSIGDIVLASPLLRVLRAKAGPGARIDFVVKQQYAELVRSCHHLSVVHELPEQAGFPELRALAMTLKKERYDLIVDLHDNVRTKYLRNVSSPREVVTVDKRLWKRWQLVHVKRNTYDAVVPVPERYFETLRDFGVSDDGKGLEIFIPDDIQSGVTARMSPLRLHTFPKVIALCPGARHFTKRWPADRYAALGGRAAVELKAKIFLFGGAEDAETCAGIAREIRKAAGENAVTDFSGTLSLLETAAALGYADVVVTNDTGLMHIAASSQRPVVAIFGSTVKEFGFFPFGTRASVVERPEVPCRPCSHIGRDRCPKGHFHCMVKIDVGDVFGDLRNML